MKKILLALIMMMPIIILAQSDKYLRKAAEGTCDCLNKTDYKSVKKTEAATALMTKCFMSGDFMNNYEKIAKECNIDASKGMNADLGRKLGERLGAKLVEINCPSYVHLVKLYMKDTGAESSENLAKSDEASGLKEEVYTMSFVKIEKTDNLNFIIFKDNKGKEIKTWWLEYFKGVELLKEKDAIGKQFKCTIFEKEFYNPKLEDYTKVKIISGLNAVK
jgi:hypothetical protein